MKRLALNFLTGLIGGMLVLAGYLYFHKPNEVYWPTRQEALPLLANENNKTIGLPDFSAAAAKSLEVVVQIHAQESQKQLKRHYPQYYHPFFEDLRSFGFGFGMPFTPQPRRGSGSGVIYSQDGYIVTNNHVVEFADDIEVILKDGRKFAAKKIGTDPNTDLAVIKVEASNLPTLEIANSDLLKIGEWVLAVGNPFGYLTSTVTAGIVSAKGRDLNLLDSKLEEEYGYGRQWGPQTPQNKAIEEFIQTDAAVNPGNSGGALVDAYGRLVGINSAIASKTGYYSGYSFAIPSNLVVKIVKELIQHGSFERGRMGIAVANIDEDFKKDLNLSTTKGVVITELEEKGSAKYAGLLPNDVIIAINGKEVSNVEELQKIVGLTKVGETLNTKIIRDGKILEIPVKIKKMI